MSLQVFLVLSIVSILCLLPSISPQALTNPALLLNNGFNQQSIINGQGSAIATVDPFAINQFVNQYAFNTLVNQNDLSFNNQLNGLNPPVNPFLGLNSILGLGTNQNNPSLATGFNTGLGLNNAFLTNGVNTAMRSNAAVEWVNNCVLSNTCNSPSNTNFSMSSNSGWIVLLVFLSLSCGVAFIYTCLLIQQQFNLNKK